MTLDSRWLCIRWNDTHWTDVYDLDVFRRATPTSKVLTHFVVPHNGGRWLPAKYTLSIDGARVTIDYCSADEARAWNKLPRYNWDQGQLILNFTDDTFRAIEEVLWKLPDGNIIPAGDYGFDFVEISSLRGSPKFNDAVVQIVGNNSSAVTPQEIRDRIKQQFPSLCDTAAQRRSVESKHHSDVDHALLAQIYTFVGANPRFERDESVTPYRIAIRGDEGDAWTDEELAASVQAYLEMHEKLRAGEPIVKKHYYDSLADRFGRTSKAFEYRMQNISYVLTLLGRQWLPGLKPARNVGANVAGKIEAFIAEVEGRCLPPVATFEIEVKEARKRLKVAPAGSKKPGATTTTITQYARDPAVKAWVLAEAKGICECCMLPAPFETSDGPFLEVHHVRQLADRGPDTIENAIAICPNCHRRLHYGIDAYELIGQLYQRVLRLVR